MFYEFPAELHIDEVRDVVASHNAQLGVDAFIEADRGEYVVFNYVVSFAESFPEVSTGLPDRDRFNAILRECRGLTFHKDSGAIAARKYHKFFNVNQKPESQAGIIDWSRQHLILEKLDGSMITPFMDSRGQISWHTKMGATEVALPVEEFVRANQRYMAFASRHCREGVTPIFEWCSRQQKIVIDYPEDRLVLTAMRDNKTGAYKSHAEMQDLAGEFEIELVRVKPGSVENISEFMEETRDLKDTEGWVVRFDDGHMVKLKAEEYCKIHRVKDNLQFEKDVLDIIIHDRLDDVLPFLDERDRMSVERFTFDLEHAMQNVALSLTRELDDYRRRVDGDKKRFAIEIAPSVGSHKSLIFAMWDGRPAFQVVREFVASNIKSSNRIQAIRQEWMAGIDWKDYRYGDFNSDD